MPLPPEIAEKLQSYVYLLIDPRSSQPFYVGKGTGARLLSHGMEASKLSPGGAPHAKLDLIKEIRASGLEPQIDVVRYGLDDVTAHAVEAALIDCLPRLTNKVRGTGTDSGRVALTELITEFAAEPLGTPSVGILLIKLGDWKPAFDPLMPNRAGGGFYSGMSRSDLYAATRCWWKVSPGRLERENVKYVVPVHNGVTRAVYMPTRWFRHPEIPRWGFDGDEVVDGPPFDELVGVHGRRIKFTRGSQNPVAYLIPGRGLLEGDIGIRDYSGT